MLAFFHPSLRLELYLEIVSNIILVAKCAYNKIMNGPAISILYYKIPLYS
jgi:hypothetical protein